MPSETGSRAMHRGAGDYRPEVVDGLAALITQMDADCAKAREILAQL